jgi:hypothetical protein
MLVASITTRPTAWLIHAAGRRASSLLGLSLILAALLLPVGRAGAGPAAQLSNVEAIVNGDDELNVRAGPGLDAPIVGTLLPGAHITVTAGPVQADGWNWCQHTSGGWSVCEPLINLQGTSILVGVAAGPAPASASASVAAAPAAAPPSAPAAPASTTASSAPSRPAPPVQTSVSLPLPGGTALIPTPTIRVAATATLVLPRPAGNPTPVLPSGVGTTPTPFTGLPQPPPGLVPGAPPGTGASTAGGTPTPTALIRIASPVPQPGQVAPGQVAPGQVAPGQVAPGQTVPGQTVPGQVPSAPGQVVPGPGILTPTPGPSFLPR